VSRQVLLSLMCIAALPFAGQTPLSKYQPATITEVNIHQETGNPAEKNTQQYEVSLKVGETVYTVLYEPPFGSNAVEYAVGQDLLVLVGERALRFSKLGSTNPGPEVPILRRETLQRQTGIDWSRARTEYFSQKLQHLSDKLALTPDQQTRIKPILEQEAGEVAQIVYNPVVSTEDKVSQFQKIVRTSDEKLKPILSSDQLLTLQTIRQQQQQELKQSLDEKSHD